MLFSFIYLHYYHLLLLLLLLWLLQYGCYYYYYHFVFKIIFPIIIIIIIITKFYVVTICFIFYVKNKRNGRNQEVDENDGNTFMDTYIYIDNRTHEQTKPISRLLNK